MHALRIARGFVRNQSRTFFAAASRRKQGNAKLFAAACALTAGIAGVAFYSQRSKAHEAKLALDPKEFREFTLVEKHPVTHNTNLYRFALQSSEHELALPVSAFILTTAEIPGEEKPVVTPYTPVTYDEKGHFDLVIKTYPNGKMSKHIGNLKVGDKLKVKGPVPKLPYKANFKKRIGMIAGGTGITPMLQVIHEITKNPEDQTEVTLLFANHTSNDIILRDRIDKIAAEHPNLKVRYIISNPEKGWTGDVGHINAELIKKYIPPPSSDTLIYVCGPPGFMNAISGPKTPDFKQGELSGALKQLGYVEDQVFKF